MEEIQVLLSPASQKQLEEFTQEAPQQVMGGILLGQFSTANSGLQITINDVIRAIHKESFLKEIHFDHQIWREIYRLKSTEYPNDAIVGWFHTCPGKPLIPSEQDYSIQKAFFQEPQKVLLLIDPVNLQSCVFYWQKNFLVPYADFLTDSKPNEIPNEITCVEQSNFQEISMQAQEMLQQSSNISNNIGSMLESRTTPNETNPSSSGIGTGIETVTSPEMSSSMSTGLKVIATISTLLTIIIFIMYPVIRPVDSQMTMPTEKSTVKNQEVALAEKTNITNQTPSTINTLPKQTPSKPSKQNLSINSINQQGQKNQPSQPLNKTIPPVVRSSERIYTIQPGDSLWSISSQFYGNGFDFYKIIRANNIINPNSLRVGKVIVVPE